MDQFSTETLEEDGGERHVSSHHGNLDEERSHEHVGHVTDSDTAGFPLATVVPQLQIPLTFEVGRTDATVAELRSMGVGYVFELTTRIEQPVVIKAYGQTIAKAELLNINGRLGVRLTEGPNCGNA